jgi:predicted metal-dependent phosphoesterase TrpH
MHTTYSDGRWPAPQLLDLLVNEGFQLVSVTDHDRVDKVAEIQALAAERGLPVLTGVEMSTDWNGKMGHMLCYGFDPAHNELQAVIDDVKRQQQENAQQVNEQLRRQGYDFPRQQELLKEQDGEVRYANDNAYLLREHGYAPDWRTAQQMATDAGQRSIKADMARTVEAVHKSGAVCLIAHPGRREHNFTFYDPALLDELRQEIPIDGIEVYHPYHSKEIIETYLDYVHTHDLLYSTGSDTHCVAGRMPIKYKAETSGKLLERLGVKVA